MRDLIIIGAGPAGLAAACSAYENGVRDILLIERDRALGGILNQCIHNGFGINYFKEELTGPEYAGRFLEMLRETSVTVLSDTMVLDVTPEKHVCCVNTIDGYQEIAAQAVVLAMGCRERTRGAIAIPGGTYAGNDADVNTVRIKSILVVRKDVPDSLAYILAKVCCEEKPYLETVQASYKDFAVEDMVQNTVVDLHPGALRYYQEAGLIK